MDSIIVFSNIIVLDSIIVLYFTSRISHPYKYNKGTARLHARPYFVFKYPLQYLTSYLRFYFSAGEKYYTLSNILMSLTRVRNHTKHFKR